MYFTTKRVSLIIYQLPVESFYKVKEFFASINYHLSIAEVLAGELPGRVYVDDPQAPRTAVVFFSSKHRVSVGGDWRNEDVCLAIGKLLEKNFRQYIQGDGTYTCNVYYSSPEWETVLDRMFGNYEHGTAQRQYYRLVERRVDWRELAVVNPELCVRLIDEHLLAEENLRNRNLLVEEIHSENPSVEHFLQHKWGFCVQQGNVLTNWCLAEYILQDQGRCELGIETLEPYQRQGLATIVADAVLDRASQSGIHEIGWHCWAANEASIATARRLGFEKVCDYAVYWCHYRRTKN